jgi:hypothetical protein
MTCGVTLLPNFDTVQGRGRPGIVGFFPFASV